MTRYFDASALVKRYVREVGSVTVRRLLASGIPASSRLSEVEISSGLIRRAREGFACLLSRQMAPKVEDANWDNYAPLAQWKPRTSRLKGYPY